MTIDEIKETIRTGRYYVADHAFEETVSDRLALSEVVSSALHGEIIEDYPDREPFPRSLVLGRTERGVPVHSVWEDDKRTGLLALVTVYRPSAEEWIEWRRRR